MCLCVWVCVLGCVRVCGWVCGCVCLDVCVFMCVSGCACESEWVSEFGWICAYAWVLGRFLRFFVPIYTYSSCFCIKMQFQSISHKFESRAALHLLHQDWVRSFKAKKTWKIFCSHCGHSLIFVSLGKDVVHNDGAMQLRATELLGL